MFVTFKKLNLHILLTFAHFLYYSLKKNVAKMLQKCFNCILLKTQKPHSRNEASALQSLTWDSCSNKNFALDTRLFDLDSNNRPNGLFQNYLWFLRFAIKEIHKLSMLLTLSFGNPLSARLNYYINMVMKDIHRFNTFFVYKK